METEWILFINGLITFVIAGLLFQYFDNLFNAQADLIDRILNHVYKSDTAEESEESESMMMDLWSFENETTEEEE